jgi:hypothetical protein
VADAVVRATALHWASDDYPGFVEIAVVDEAGREHRIIEKVAVLTTSDLTPASAFPVELWIRADTGSTEGEKVHITFAHAVETTEGLTSLSLSVKDVRWGKSDGAGQGSLMGPG